MKKNNIIFFFVLRIKKYYINRLFERGEIQL